MTTIKRYEGSDHVYNNQNGDTCVIKGKAGNSLNIECNNISANNAFKYIRRGQSGSQSITGGIDTPILFNTSNTNENPYLVVTSSGGGSLFTVTTKPQRFIISWSFRFSSGTGTTFQTWLKTSNLTAFFGQIHSYSPSITPALSSTCIISLPVGASFQIFAFSNSNSSISADNGVSASTIQIYNLP